ncbi:Dynein light chain-related protein [Penicillium frequentans]|uniref:Dynein light chain-related protein n=1 Tax=Penicillium frequentans TaxID=3151616 RepID=A0AAD6GLN4_9EURO|nr:Dynein light chain-related protein [Penicillium glabrum]
MANPPRTQQVPQHVTALLSHLTSRPGVQSTLILSRKDGSIIQRTGQLAPQEPSPRPAPTTTEQATLPSEGPSRTHLRLRLKRLRTGRLTLKPHPNLNRYHPPTSTPGLEGEFDYANGSLTPREEVDESTDREEDEEVKLLRMRTRKHEIVVVPDRKYLLCVVHDASHASGGPSARAARSSR